MALKKKNNASCLVLIDGNAIMHRAYHALPPLTNKQGEPIHAVYGFVTMLITIVNKLSPTHLIVCFDRPEPTFRKSMYVGYQAHRPKMDSDLSSQFEKVKKVISVMNIPLYEMPGYEADDVIGSLSLQASEHSDVIIVTGDRDILQLVTDTIQVYMPVQGLSNGKLYSPSDVEKKFGVTPSQIVDYKALAGDSSDNYPGVRGIGPKTASMLLQTFGTLENLYQAIYKKDKRVETLKNGTLKALSEYAEDAGMAKKLARIVIDAPVTLDRTKAELHELATPQVLKTLSDLGFLSIVRRLETNAYEEEIRSEIKPIPQTISVEKPPEICDEQMSLL